MWTSLLLLLLSPLLYGLPFSILGTSPHLSCSVRFNFLKAIYIHYSSFHFRLLKNILVCQWQLFPTSCPPAPTSLPWLFRWGWSGQKWTQGLVVLALSGRKYLYFFCGNVDADCMVFYSSLQNWQKLSLWKGQLTQQCSLYCSEIPMACFNVRGKLESGPNWSICD